MLDMFVLIHHIQVGMFALNEDLDLAKMMLLIQLNEFPLEEILSEQEQRNEIMEIQLELQDAAQIDYQLLQGGSALEARQHLLILEPNEQPDCIKTMKLTLQLEFQDEVMG